jgi:hypothetical protein
MTPKEKAKKLVDEFYQRFPLEMDVVTTRGDLSWEYDNWKEAKQCALIAVDEILKIELLVESVDDYYLRYWKEVRSIIDSGKF